MLFLTNYQQLIVCQSFGQVNIIFHTVHINMVSNSLKKFQSSTIASFHETPISTTPSTINPLSSTVDFVGLPSSATLKCLDRTLDLNILVGYLKDEFSIKSISVPSSEQFFQTQCQFILSVNCDGCMLSETRVDSLLKFMYIYSEGKYRK